MPKQAYETSALLNNARVKTSRLEDYKIVDNAFTPEIYTLISTDGAIIPDKLAITLIDGDSMETKVGNGKVWSECLSLGESGEMPTTVSWNDVSGKPTTFAPTIGTTSTTAKAGNYQPTWDQVTSKPVVIAAGDTQSAARTAIGAGTSNYTLPTGGTASNFLKGDNTWNVVLPSDVTTTLGTGNNRIPSFNGGTNTWGASTPFSTSSLNSSIAQRGTTGTLKASNATASDDLVAFGQVITQTNIESTTNTVQGLTTGQRSYQAFTSYAKGGMATFTGNDSTQTLTIPHGLGTTPRFISCDRNADTGEDYTPFASTYDATNIVVTFATPPMTGVNIMINWAVFK